MSSKYSLTNKGKSDSRFFSEIMNLKIESLSIHIIPLKQYIGSSIVRILGRTLQQIIHPAIISPTLSHIAIQLNLENKYIVVMEYGPYLSDKSEIRNSDSNQPRIINKNLEYYYINKDGARITLIDSIDGFAITTNLDQFSREQLSIFTLSVIAANEYNISLEEFEKIKETLPSIKEFYRMDCDVINKISLIELCNYFKNEKWEANSYNLANHNCQTFAAEIIRILKAVRINDYDKIRMIEKRYLPNCIISILWDNEDLSPINTIGRIPVIGYLFDSVSSRVIKNK